MADIKDTIAKAVALAEEYHAEQKYSSGAPYVHHLLHVQQVLFRFGYNPFGVGDDAHLKLSENLAVAAILHDIVEDTDFSLKDVKSAFGKRVASLVNGVTNEPGVNRKERHRKTYPKTKRIPGAIILKLADRIANVEACLALGDSRIGMYRKEWVSFQEALRVEGEHERMWRHLDLLIAKSDGRSRR